MTKDEVKFVQERLDELGFSPGPIDGIIGPLTSSAVIAFKQSIGLRPRAYVGPITWRALSEKNEPVQREELPWMREARKVLGLHEIYDNKELAKWLASDGYALGDPAQLPWCGDFIETSIRLALRDERVPKNPYWALNWKQFGIPCKPSYGCIAAIRRSGGGHVMFIVGEDHARYYALGGNQANRASIVPVEKSRFTNDSFRWPLTANKEPSEDLPWITSTAEANRQEA